MDGVEVLVALENRAYLGDAVSLVVKDDNVEDAVFVLNR